jgi:hypothetical protein
MDTTTPDPDQTGSLLGWALCFAAMGWHVFPLRPGTKHPTGHREADCPRTGRCTAAHQTPEMRATTNPDKIRAAWQAAPYGIGIATGPSGLVVIDLDQPKDGAPSPDGETALADLAARRGAPIPATYTVTTPHGGKHLYFRSPAGVRLRSTQKKLAATVDTRAWGGYVVAPGTSLADGGYELIDDTDPVELPGWLVQVCAETPPVGTTGPVQIRSTDTGTYGAAALRGECDRVREAPPASHNAVLSTAAYTIGRKVGADLIDHSTARADLIAAAAHMTAADCDCDTREIERVVEAGLAAGAKNPVARRKDAA